jgi:ABC-type glutathione transport system ATPase component
VSTGIGKSSSGTPITVDNVSCSYGGKKEAVSGLSFELGEGEIFGLCNRMRPQQWCICS